MSLAYRKLLLSPSKLVTLAETRRGRADFLGAMSFLVAAYAAYKESGLDDSSSTIQDILTSLNAITREHSNIEHLTIEHAVSSANDLFALNIIYVSDYAANLLALIEKRPPPRTTPTSSSGMLNFDVSSVSNAPSISDMMRPPSAAERAAAKGLGISRKRAKSIFPIPNNNGISNIITAPLVSTDRSSNDACFVTLENDYVLLKPFFDANGISEAARAAHVVIFKHTIGFRIKNKPKWLDKQAHDELKNLYAPAFLKTVHSEVIFRNHVYKETIRAYDPALMTAIEGYISQREGRKSTLGEAADLIFVSSKPATNKAAHTPERPSRKAGTQENKASAHKAMP